MIADRSAYGFSKTLEELIWNVESGKATRRGILLPGKLVLGVGPYSARVLGHSKIEVVVSIAPGRELSSSSRSRSALARLSLGWTLRSRGLSLSHSRSNSSGLSRISLSCLPVSLSLSLSLILPLSLSSRLCATPVLRLEGRRCLHDRLDDLLRGGKLHVQRRVEGLVCEGA